MTRTRPTTPCSAPRRSLAPALTLALALALAASGALVGSTARVTAAGGFDPLPQPRRLLDTRPGGATFDGDHSGAGTLPAATTYRLPVAGRAGVPASAALVALNVTAIGRDATGFVTVHPCAVARPDTSNLNYEPGRVVAGMTIARIGDDGDVCLYVHRPVDLVVDAIGGFDAGAFDALTPTRRLLDTRPGETTVDGEFVGGGPVPGGGTLAVDVANRGTLPDRPGPLLVTLTVLGEDRGYLTAWGCGDERPWASNVNYVAGQRIANTAVVDVDADGRLCLFAHGAAHLIVDVIGRFDPGAITVLDPAARLLDTRPSPPSVPRPTVDGHFSGKGLRPGTATLQLPVAGRGGVPTTAGAVIVNLTAVQATGRGYATVHPPGPDTPTASNLNHAAGQTIANQAIIPLDASGDICIHNWAGTHLVLDVVAYLPGPPASPLSGECPAQRLFPHWRLVALYGNDSAPVLGALGEQGPDAAAARLERVAAPYRRPGERPVLPVFELIATVAQAAPGPSGLYRARSSDAFIQRYLDAARRHGVYLLLDLQPGRSDFLTEAKAYEKFLREPDVGLALDPEWRTEPPNRPGGGYVGRVDASEVNAVADWLATLVEEEDLPEKLLVVHQFQIRMITDKDQLREPEGIALTIHMDGFGTRSQKLTTYSYVHVDEPWNNGFKLFYDEDIDMFRPDDLLHGPVVPVPDVITHQ